MVGSANGTSITRSSSALPGKSSRTNTQATTVPNTTFTTVTSTACVTVSRRAAAVDGFDSAFQ